MDKVDVTLQEIYFLKVNDFFGKEFSLIPANKKRPWNIQKALKNLNIDLDEFVRNRLEYLRCLPCLKLVFIRKDK